MVKRIALIVGLVGLFLSMACPDAGAAAGFGGFGRRADSDDDEAYVVYKEEDYYGNLSLALNTSQAFDARRDAVKKFKVKLNGKMLYIRAFLEARKAWREDPERKDIRFPLRSVQAPVCRRKREFDKLLDANWYLDKLREREERKKEKADKLRRRKLAAMSQAKREKLEGLLEKRAELLTAAKNLYEERIAALLEKVGGR